MGGKVDPERVHHGVAKENKTKSHAVSYTLRYLARWSRQPTQVVVSDTAAERLCHTLLTPRLPP